MEKGMIEIPHTFLKDLIAAYSILHTMMLQCGDGQEGLYLHGVDCDLDRIINRIKCIDGETYAYIYERR